MLANSQQQCIPPNLLAHPCSVDGEGPYSWTPASGGPAPGGRWKHDILASQGGDSYTWRYRLPAGVSCDRCVLQVGQGEEERETE